MRPTIALVAALLALTTTAQAHFPISVPAPPSGPSGPGVPTAYPTSPPGPSGPVPIPVPVNL